MKQFRVQRSNHQGVKPRAWGYGKVASWSPWRTVFMAPTLEGAEELYERWSKIGLSRWRIVHGTEVKRQS